MNLFHTVSRIDKRETLKTGTNGRLLLESFYKVNLAFLRVISEWMANEKKMCQSRNMSKETKTKPMLKTESYYLENTVSL